MVFSWIFQHLGLLGGFNPYGYVFDPTGWIDPLGLAACHDSGELGRQKSIRDLGKNDFEIVGEEVTMRVNGSRIRADFVARDSDGRLHVFESKHGNSRLTPNQSSSGVYDIGNPSNNNGVIDTSKGKVSRFEIATGNQDKISGISPDAEKSKIYEAVFHVLKYE
ncbi:Uncharacterised protein [Pasteurella dagmatis]|uniref:RHS repeat-associated core domain protein n=1 Tax=Pasteurella dagmatis ATCC 43325 TaxID=667128 RepID=C9PMJ6_9PAST|nr:hypothetical protein HMPREF0621_0220 [Pasteurella dagmatis ATCC 43325]SNV41635.1 Uncharacterised protein [Pasteurella dagmatis]